MNNRTISIAILIVSIVAFIGAVYVCIIEPSVSNILIAALLVLVIAYEAWQIASNKKKSQ